MHLEFYTLVIFFLVKFMNINNVFHQVNLGFPFVVTDNETTFLT